MYLTLSQVTLIADQSKSRPDDAICYVRTAQRRLLSAAPGERILTVDDTVTEATGPAERYGRLYYDARDEPCVVPDVWSEDDAALAREAIR